jgi:Phosphotransferase enzyme family
MIGELRAVLMARAREWGLPREGEWSFLVHNNHQPDYTGVNVFWFHNRGRDPLVFTKVFPEPTLPQQEFRNLQDAHASAPGVVPRPFGLFGQGRFWALWMAGLPGSRLTANLLSDEIIDELCDALITIQKGVAARRPANPLRQQEYVCVPLEYAARRYPAISEDCRRVLANCSGVLLDRVPVLPQHGDLSRGNIVVNGDKSLGIVDWELLGVVDLPFYDIIRLLFSLDSGPAPDRWQVASQKKAQHLIARYMQALRMERQEFAFLLPLLLANWLHRQPLPQGKALAAAAFEDYLARPSRWERALLTDGDARSFLDFPSSFSGIPR